MRIADIIGHPIPSPTIAKHGGKIVELTSPVTPVHSTLPYEFEGSVLTFLVEHRRPLGIAHVFQAKNLLVDGGLALEDGRFIAVEIKTQGGYRPRRGPTGFASGTGDPGRPLGRTGPRRPRRSAPAFPGGLP
jgi:hypothetical protein